MVSKVCDFFQKFLSTEKAKQSETSLIRVAIAENCRTLCLFFTGPFHAFQSACIYARCSPGSGPFHQHLDAGCSCYSFARRLPAPRRILQ